MADLAALKAFNFATAELSVWVFKRSERDGQPVFTGRWVGITDNLMSALRQATENALQKITETIDYSILAQNNESSALILGSDETHIALVEAVTRNPTPSRRVTRLKDIANTDFYILRFVTSAGKLLAIRKTNSSWSTKRSNELRLVFADEELDIDNRPAFSLEPFFDFFVLDESIFISNKSRFESVLSYRSGHVEAFHELQMEDVFSSLFSDMAPITNFVGSNKIQLRRVIAIREKGHYRDPDFMSNLRAQCSAMSLRIDFDENGRIIATPETCRDIFVALLDHRLDSRLSRLLYDVPSTQSVVG